MTQFNSRLAGMLSHVGDARGFQRPFFILMAIFLVFYFSELANFSLSIDEEMAAVPHSPLFWVATDRWLNYLIERFVVPPAIFPFFPIFVFGALTCLGYMAVVRAHRYSLEDAPVLLIFILFGAFPILYFLIDFSAIVINLGIGLLLSCFGLLVFARALDVITGQGPRRALAGCFLWQAGLGVAALGVYQSLILLIAAGCCGIFLLRYLRQTPMSVREIMLIHGYLAANLLASLVLGMLVSHGFQWALAVQPNYIQGFIHLDQTLQRPLDVLHDLVRQYWQIYGGKRAVYGFRYVAFPALLLLGMFALAARVADRNVGRILFVILYMVGITAIPFALNVVTGGFLPYRVFIAVPYVFWFFAGAAVLSHLPVLRRVAVALVILVAVQCLYTFSMFQAEKRLVLDHDKILAGQIYDRIVGQIPDFDRTKIYKVDFYGAYGFETVYREIAGSTISGSFFEWDRGNPARIAAFMRILGYSNIEAADSQTRKAMIPVIQDMTLWPAEGSVRVVEGTVLVRLGKDPGLVHRTLMTPISEP